MTPIANGQRLAADCRGLEQRQPGQRPLEPGRVRVDDPVAVHEQPHRRPVAVARRVSKRLGHTATVARRGAVAPLRESTLPIGPSYVNLANQVGAVPFLGKSLGPDAGSLYVGVGSTLKPGPTHRVDCVAE